MIENSNTSYEKTRSVDSVCVKESGVPENLGEYENEGTVN